MNFGTPVPLLLGIFMVISSVALFFLERLKPGYERDSDKVYAILFLLSGVFLLVNLGMDVISSFQQMLLAGMLAIKAAGLDTAALGVDAENPTGALRLYESVGFTVDGTDIAHCKDL